MGFGNLGFSEMLVVAVIILIFFGPRRLPEIGQSLGRAMREFRRSLNEIKRELEDVNPRSVVARELDLDPTRAPEPPRATPRPPEPAPPAPPPPEPPSEPAGGQPDLFPRGSGDGS
ncbi:MAG: twin-arginine translocase TatA/TatE family subunit [Gemmatimonadota bacterium]